MTETEKTILAIQALEQAKISALKTDIGNNLKPFYLEFADLKSEFGNISPDSSVDGEVLLIALNTLENVFKVLQRENIIIQ